MAIKLDAAKMEEEFRRHQSILAARSGRRAFTSTTRILAFVGLHMICRTLIKMPKTTGGGFPLLFDYGILYSFITMSVTAVLLNLTILWMLLRSHLNERKLNNTTAPTVEFIQKCLSNQKEIIGNLDIVDWSIDAYGLFFCVYAFLIAVFGSLFPYREISVFYSAIKSYHTEIIMRYIQIGVYLHLLWTFVGYPVQH